MVVNVVITFLVIYLIIYKIKDLEIMQPWLLWVITQIKFFCKDTRFALL